MFRFFVRPQDIDEEKVKIKGSDFYHITRSLRLGEDDKILVMDGNGARYLCVISQIGDEMVLCDIIENMKTDAEPAVRVILFQGIPKSGKMDTIVRVCTEIGIAEIVPVICERTVVKLTKESKKADRIGRWQRIAQEAAKQSHRNAIPKIHEVQDFKKAVHSLVDLELPLIIWEDEKKTRLRNIFAGNREPQNTIGIFIGPEGGFDSKEVEYANECGALSVGLGPRILRTETAGPCVCSLILYATGELG